MLVSSILLYKIAVLTLIIAFNTTTYSACASNVYLSYILLVHFACLVVVMTLFVFTLQAYNMIVVLMQLNLAAKIQIASSSARWSTTVLCTAACKCRFILLIFIRIESFTSLRLGQLPCWATTLGTLLLIAVYMGSSNFYDAIWPLIILILWAKLLRWIWVETWFPVEKDVRFVRSSPEHKFTSQCLLFILIPYYCRGVSDSAIECLVWKASETLDKQLNCAKTNFQTPDDHDTDILSKFMFE